MENKTVFTQDFIDACNKAFETECTPEDFQAVFNVYPTARTFGIGEGTTFDKCFRYTDRAKIVDNMYVAFDDLAYKVIAAKRAVENGLVRDDYSTDKNVFLFESGEVRWLYFGFDMETGVPHFCENCCYDSSIKKITKMENISDEEFFNLLEDQCTQLVHSCDDVHDYNSWAEVFKENPDRKLDAQLREEIINNALI